MSKPTKAPVRRYTVDAAIKLHAEAQKSDPFAAKRMAMTLRKLPREKDHVGKEADKIISSNRHTGNAFVTFFNSKAGAFLRMDINAAAKPRKNRTRGVVSGRWKAAA